MELTWRLMNDCFTINCSHIRSELDYGILEPRFLSQASWFFLWVGPVDWACLFLRNIQQSLRKEAFRSLSASREYLLWGSHNCTKWVPYQIHLCLSPLRCSEMLYLYGLSSSTYFKVRCKTQNLHWQGAFECGYWYWKCWCFAHHKKQGMGKSFHRNRAMVKQSICNLLDVDHWRHWLRTSWQLHKYEKDCRWWLVCFQHTRLDS